MKPIFLKNTEELRKWLNNNHKKESEIWLGYYKKRSSKFNFSWSDSVDELLCYGWIDGLRKSLDKERYMIRITPRKRKSNWSRVNSEKVARLIQEQRMQSPGLKAFANFRKESTGKYSFERDHVELDENYKKSIKENANAWEFFEKLSPSVKKQSVWWIMSAKREDTRLRRLNVLINSSSNQEKIPQLTWKKKPV